MTTRAPGQSDSTATGPLLGVPELIGALEVLHAEMRREHVARADDLARIDPTHRHGAANLIDYLVLRRHDIRPVQLALAELGLSSLGRAEEHVINTVERVLGMLYLLSGKSDEPRTEAAVGFGGGRDALETHADALLGPSRRGRSTRILVTMPTEAADDAAVVRELMRRGMGCARINCAHDDQGRWEQMVNNIRQAARELGEPCPILMDLPGPKLRTGPVEAGPRVLALHPRRDAWGRASHPAHARLVATEEAGAGARDAVCPRIPVGREWLDGVQPGDVVRLRDTRGDHRSLLAAGRTEDGVEVEAWDTTYVETGTELVDAGGHRTPVGLLPPLEQALVLRVGDVLTLTADQTPAAVPQAGVPGHRATPAPHAGREATAPRIGCTLPEALDALAVGHRVLFDDGKITGTVVAVRAGEVDVGVTAARPHGSRLRAEKGINLPDSELRLPALGPLDEPLLGFIVGQADMVGLSFAQSVEDVRLLQDLLRRRGASPGIVLKIETGQGFANLPELLLAAMASERVGVMVARGDLAVECGFERLAELQEEILWLCDAAHLPVIWATQVLDQMARSGQPSRAEISDAAMSGRAECVMLNKGPHIVDAVSALDDILRRMNAHQQKKVALLRRLQSWAPSGD